MEQFSKILTRLKHQIQRDLHDKECRSHEFDAVVQRYLKKCSSARRDESRFAPLDKLAEELESAGIDSLELYKQAWDRNTDDSELLLKVSRTLLSRGDNSKESMVYYKAAADIEDNKFPLFEKLRSFYRKNGMIYELMLINEKIVDTFESYVATVQSGTDKEKLKLAEVNWENAGRLKDAAKGELLQVYINLGRKDKRAAALYKEALENDPDNVEIIELLAEIAAGDTRTDPEALRIYEQYVAYKSDDRNVIILLSKGYLKEGNEREALSLLENHVNRFPDDAECLQMIVSYYMKQPKIDENAVHFLKQYFQAHPQDLDVLVRIVDFFTSNKRTDEEAVSYYKRMLPIAENPDTYLFLIARHYYDHQSWLDAIEVFEQLYTHGNREPQLIKEMATAYAFCERTDSRAITIYEQAIKLGAESRNIKEILSEYYTASNRVDDIAFRCFTETIQSNPDHAAARLGLVHYYFLKHDYSATAKEAAAFLHIEDAHEGVLQMASRAIVLSNEGDEVLKTFNSLPVEVVTMVYHKAFTQNPNLNKVTLWLADRFIEEERKDREALNVYSRALSLSPHNIKLLNMQSLSRYQAGQEEDAINVDKRIYSLCSQTCVLKTSIPPTKRAVCTNVCIRLAKAILEKKIHFPNDQVYSILRSAYQKGYRDKKIIASLGDLCMRMGRTTEEDLSILENAFSLYPQRSDTARFLARAYLERRKPELAIKYCSFLLEKDADDESALDIIIDSLSQYSYCNSKLQSLLEDMYLQNPANSKLNLALSLLYGRLQEFNETTLRFFERAAQIRPDDALIQMFLARCYENLEEFQKAIYLYQRIRWAIPDDSQIITRLARSYMKAGVQTETVLDIVEKANAIEPDDEDLTLYRFRLLLSLGRCAKALDIIQELANRPPEKITQIIEILEEHISLRANSPSPAMAQLASFLIERGDYDAGLKYLEVLSTDYKNYFTELMEGYNNIIDREAHHMLARIERAILYRLLGEFELSVQDLESILDFAESSPNILYELTETYEGWIKSEKDNSRRLTHLYKLGRIYYRINEFEHCIGVYQQILQIDKLSSEALLYLARCFFHKQNYELSLQYCKGLEKNDDVKKLLYELGDAFYENQKLKLAADSFKGIIDVDIGFRDTALKLNEVKKELHEVMMHEKERESLMKELSDKARSRFELREEVGRGAWSIVLKAYDRELDETVALKVLPSNFSENEVAVESFKNEAKLARRLSHPRIVRLYDIGEESNRKYLSMEYIQGKNLQVIIAMREKIPPLETIAIATQIADALQYAHSKGVLHRDIKPANIIITFDDIVKITDFGIASVVSQSEPHSAGYLAGTPLYMSPEQIEGKVCTPTSDLYSLGIVIYEMLSGSPPFTTGDIAYHHVHSSPPPLRDIPSALTKVVFKCLQKKPEDRYSSADEVIKELKGVRDLLESE